MRNSVENSKLNQLTIYGWNDHWSKKMDVVLSEMSHTNAHVNYLVGRVFVEYGLSFHLMTEHGEVESILMPHYLKETTHSRPAVGDWVLYEEVSSQAIIRQVLPRSSKFSRKAAGNEVLEQVVAANFDTVFIVNALNRDFNLRRIERYLTVAWESGATPVVILSKTDLCEDLEEKIKLVEEIALGVEVHAISAITEQGLEALQPYFENNQTVVVLGSSGVGKSTLVNTLLGSEHLKTFEVREEDQRGRHTTTHRELVALENGGLILDTPGMRELMIWDGIEGLSQTFSDIEELMLGCKYRDCQHEKEPGCAVLAAVEEGQLSEKRLINYHKLKKEIRFIEGKQNQRIRLEEKQKYKTLSKSHR